MSPYHSCPSMQPRVVYISMRVIDVTSCCVLHSQLYYIMYSSAGVMILFKDYWSLLFFPVYALMPVVCYLID